MRRATRRYKTTVIGLGAMGMRHARVIRGLDERFELVGGFDVRPDLHGSDGLRRMRSHSEAIDQSDLLVIATPIETHTELVASALAAGRHVLVEKPLCATAADASTLVASARLGGRLFVGHSERFNPVVRALARFVRAEQVLGIDLRRVGRSRESGFGVLVHLGVHDFDLVGYLCGGGVAVRSAAAGRSSATGGEDFAHVLLTTASGSIGHVYVDRTTVAKQRTITVATHRWRYEGDLLDHRLVRADGSEASRADVPLPFQEPLVAQAIALADALDGYGGRDIATGTDGAFAVALAEQAAAYCKLPSVLPSNLPALRSV